MKDFSAEIYETLCATIASSTYAVSTVSEYIKAKPPNALILRHDVDRFPKAAYRMAKVESTHGLKATYYFRFKKKVLNKKIVRDISAMEHEIGYHYEVCSTAKGDMQYAEKIAQRELAELRKIVPVTSASMHGRPFSRWNNKDLWKYFPREHFGLVGEAYMDIDYDQVKYFSDTGRTWHSSKYNIRDHVNETREEKNEILDTYDLIDVLKKEEYRSVCILVHPERWASNVVTWSASWLSDTIVNQAKIALLLARRLKR